MQVLKLAYSTKKKTLEMAKFPTRCVVHQRRFQKTRIEPKECRFYDMRLVVCQVTMSIIIMFYQ